MVKFEIVYHQAGGQLTRITLESDASITVAQALDRSGIFQQHPEARALSVGIFGRQVDLSQQVKNGDRIEIYRPLTANPMDKRRQRATSNK